MKQTALEFLLSYLPQIDYGNDPYYDEIINKAKELERKQILDACESAERRDFWVKYEDFEDYYNETFKK